MSNKLIPLHEDGVPQIDSEGLLICPVCGPKGFGYLHQGEVTVYDRRREDDAESMVTRCGTNSVTTQLEGNRSNPSARRQGLTVAFSCENCGDGEYHLTIAQHKGQTFVGWRIIRMPSETEGR